MGFIFHARVFRWIVPTLVLIWLTCASPAPAQTGHPEQASQKDFSFVVLGDTRGYFFLPGGRENERSFLQMLHLYPMGGHKDVPVISYDPAGEHVVRVDFLSKTKKPTATATYEDGWPARIEKASKDGMVTVMRNEGFDFVAKGVIDRLHGTDGEPSAAFAIHGGDMVLWGGQGRTLAGSPYWKRLNEKLLSKLPPARPGLAMSLFPVVGNHELWDDPDLAGMRSTFPALADIGFTKDDRTYEFAYGQSRFIVLDTGDYDCGKDGWCGEHPDFKGQMERLRAWLEAARRDKAGPLFVVFHKPAFCLVKGHPALLPSQSPHALLAQYAKDLDISVFSSHAHATELFKVDGTRYFVMGAGGAPQSLAPAEAPPGYPEELYWKGEPRVEEYAYLETKVAGGKPRFFLHRWRPGANDLAPVVEVFKK